jgi:hypothetical protein
MVRIVTIFVCVLAFGCKKDSATSVQETELPVVIVSQTNYHESDVRATVPDQTLLNHCTELYKGKYTDELKSSLNVSMMTKAQRLGLDVAELTRCMNATGQLHAGLVSLPYRVERASYDSVESWILQFAWGMAPDDLGHYRCFVMSAAAADTLLFITCR